MRVFAVIVGAVLVLALLAACNPFKSSRKVIGSSVRKEEKRSVSDFTSVEISGGFDVEILAQSDYGLTIEGDDNILSMIKTEVRDGVLDIDTGRSKFNIRRPIHIKVSAPKIESLSSSGANTIRLADVSAETLRVDSSGADKIVIDGDVVNFELSLSGVSNADARELRAQTVRVSTSGASNASVYATEELDAKVSGAGSVSYYGNPKTVREKTSGAGSIARK